ncbi:GNAT family N-acetyltransferase [Vibrio parahaemolyticus]|uniref:GNAT family N-acetyltransferase n=1 Tax=Vibrio parahaemolyticus TaxID=670 RepID=UPI001D4B2981|nr:GNAT family N-acetyltransferase [Vibrio parahaemolyticus]EGR2301707.1 GNAT family N-acetyltransferase [Vibrio parahaemolyticus]EHH1258766.1 GNAT family N-acetyltransferase [Vibrio parahaemolyticus]EJG1722875.1 GNAT family N-acetyltransferase [Vibrio parahaemolyticus]EJG1736521.1 GNAT family N-acetyltransferase [Vibrio parahaemolyticus]EJG1750363.1 GNAT family N-acetyltransferase [Vibrio parahaemolyticus]
MIDIKMIKASEIDTYLGDLCTLLIDCVEEGASIGFLSPLVKNDAEQYWEAVKESIKNNTTYLHIALSDDQLVGCVLLSCSGKANGVHRAEIEKMMVSPTARRCGIASSLLNRTESLASNLDLKLLVLDTRENDVSEALYQKHAFVKVGVIPQFALSSQGDLAGTSIYYKLIEARSLFVD